MPFNVIYLPIGVGTFHLESAQEQFDQSAALLRGLDSSVACPDSMLLTIDALRAFLAEQHADLAVVQNLTFANAAYMSEILHRLDCPVLLWTLREPVIDGTRLRLNSLTGAFSAGNMLCQFGRPFSYVFGSPDETAVENKIKAAIAAAKLRKNLRSLRVLQIGHTPQGFGFGRALDAEMMTVFGAELLSVESRELISLAKSFSEEEIEPYYIDASKRINGLDKIAEKNVSDFARLYKAYADFTKENRIGALSSRCWPDFFVDFGTPVCAVLGILNDLGIPASCEADTYGALSMYAAAQLTNRPAFFGDPVSMNEQENTVTFWHCGMAPCSLARTDTGAAAGVHCNRKIGPTLEFGCKKEKEVTILRIGKKQDGSFRIFAANGEALDKPQQFYGTSIVVKTESDASALINRAVTDGWEPHFAVAMGNIKTELQILAQMLGIEFLEY